MNEDWRDWDDVEFGRISDFLRDHETSPSQLRVIVALVMIACDQFDLIEDSDIISTCAEALCALATPYAEAEGFDPIWKVDLA